MLRPGLKFLRRRIQGIKRFVSGKPAIGATDWGDLRRSKPLCNDYGHSRGLPVDRMFIERFLAAHATDIHGHVLEIGGNEYTLKFGAERVILSDVLDVKKDNPRATINADLTRADHLPSNQYDAIILTQTLQLIYDIPAAIRTVHRLLKPGGVLLITVSGISSIGSAGGDDTNWCWSFTPRSLELLLRIFGPYAVEVASYGSVLTAVAFLHGMAAEELMPSEFDIHDIDYPIVVSARAVKPFSGPGS